MIVLWAWCELSSLCSLVIDELSFMFIHPPFPRLNTQFFCVFVESFLHSKFDLFKDFVEKIISFRIESCVWSKHVENNIRIVQVSTWEYGSCFISAHQYLLLLIIYWYLLGEWYQIPTTACSLSRSTTGIYEAGNEHNQ